MKLNQQGFPEKQIYDLRMNKGSTVADHLNEFNAIINKLLLVVVKVEDEGREIISPYGR